MMNPTETLIETDNLAQAGQVILSHLPAFADGKLRSPRTSIERAHYRAVRNWLIHHQPTEGSTALGRTTGLLEAFYHLCEVEAWDDAAELLFVQVNLVNSELQGARLDSFHLQLGRWGHYAVQVQLYQQLLGHGTLETEMICCNGLGLAHQSLGKYADATAYHTQHLALAREAGDDEAKQNALCNLGNVYGALGQQAEATTAYEEALELARQHQDSRGEGKLLGNLGVLKRLQGDFQGAIAYHQQHLAIALDLDDQDGQMNALDNLGIAHYYLGIYDVAKDFFQSSLRMSRQTGDQKSRAATLGSLGNISTAQGELEEALGFYQRQLTISREIGYVEGEEKALGNMGTMYKELGDYEASLNHLRQKLTLARQLQSREGEAAALSNLGNTYTCLGQYDEAIRCQQESIEIAEESGDRWGHAAALCNLGDAYRLAKRFKVATASLLSSLLLFDFLQAPQTETVLVLLTQIALEIGVEEYALLLEQNLEMVQQFHGEKGVRTLRNYLFEV